MSKEEFIGCLTRFGFKLRREVERDLADSLTDQDRERERDREGDRDRGGDRDRDRERGRKGIDYNDFITALKAESDAEGQAEGLLERLRERMRRGAKRGAGMQEVSETLKYFKLNTKYCTTNYPHLSCCLTSIFHLNHNEYILF